MHLIPAAPVRLAVVLGLGHRIPLQRGCRTSLSKVSTVPSKCTETKVLYSERRYLNITWKLPRTGTVSGDMGRPTCPQSPTSTERYLANHPTYGSTGHPRVHFLWPAFLLWSAPLAGLKSRKAAVALHYMPFQVYDMAMHYRDRSRTEILK